MVSRISSLTTSSPPTSSHLTSGILGAPIRSLNLFLALLMAFSKSSDPSFTFPPSNARTCSHGMERSTDKSSSLSMAVFFAFSTIDIRSLAVSPALWRDNVSKETS
ncbi:hypothetical protein OGAPHI_004867 [Ogataea philodendri]|uniref:Uncharacterized protein n=1 Tax=Ogataea philodendri TaxID=1378263 RepID=A0A9P8P254_9ASCO|nr:uncharacterized protein OGAPHI_004867 [Ogataea philodendri]KAH3664153.1 hypothetical protein OGAPHI_004867 [Ogataea philodendri]